MVALHPTNHIPSRTAFAESAPIICVDNQGIPFTLMVKGALESAVFVRLISRSAEVAFDQCATIQVAFKSFDIDHHSHQ